MKITINGQLLADSSLDYDRIHQLVNDNSYNSIGDAIISKVSDAIHHTEWYHHTPYKFDLVHNFNDVQAICGDYTGGLGSPACYIDAFNWSIMNKTELTADIYKFISDRMAIMRDGIQNNLIPHHHLDFGGIFNLVDWHFILDCISWFI